jgi:UDP-glucose 6-dehydrogenase
LIKCGYSADNVLKAIGSDSRIGNKYLKWGYGFGGPCFPRDNRAFGHFAEKLEVEPLICFATDKSNEAHLKNQLSFEIMNNKEKVKIFDYITYKPESTLLVESQQLKFALMLADNGFDVTIRERKNVIEELRQFFEKNGYATKIKLLEKQPTMSGKELVG